MALGHAVLRDEARGGPLRIASSNARPQPLPKGCTSSSRLDARRGCRSQSEAACTGCNARSCHRPSFALASTGAFFLRSMAGRVPTGQGAEYRCSQADPISRPDVDWEDGGRDWDRTSDPCDVNAVLVPLSYAPGSKGTERLLYRVPRHQGNPRSRITLQASAPPGRPGRASGRASTGSWHPSARDCRD